MELKTRFLVRFVHLFQYGRQPSQAPEILVMATSSPLSASFPFAAVLGATSLRSLASFVADLSRIAQEPVELNRENDTVTLLVANETAALRLAFAYSATAGIRYGQSLNLGRWYVCVQ